MKKPNMLLVFSCLILLIVSSCKKNKGEVVNYSASNSSILLKRAHSLPAIEIDSLQLNSDSLLVFITDTESDLFNEVLIDQYIKILFQDYSFASSGSFNQVKIKYQIPKRDSIGYHEIMDISIKTLKQSLVMFTNKSFREIVDTMTVLQRENLEINLLDQLNFFSNQVLFQDKKIEFQFFGFNFMELITHFLLECETGNGNYYRRTMREVFSLVGRNEKMPDELMVRLNNVFKQNCDYLKNL